MIKKLLTTVVAGMLWASTAQAAFITIDEPGLDAIYSQASFGANTVDIRIGAPTQLVAPNLLDITTDVEIGLLFGMHVGALNVVNFYFVDSISSCGIINPAIVGCGETPGNDFVVESVFANSANNAELMGHELGHNLNLGHRNGASTLMNPSINNGVDLNAAEVATILNSPLVQSDANGLFIQINPVLIVAQAAGVPVPATALLMLVGLLAMRSRRRTLA